MDERNQSATDPSLCFKCKATLPSLTALEVHLRSCTTEWEPPQSVPWTFIPPPDSLGGPGPAAGAGRGRGGSRGRASSRRRGTDKKSSGGGSYGESNGGSTQAQGRDTTGSDTRGRGGHRGRGRGARDDKAERNGQGGGRGRRNRGSTRAGKQNADNLESTSSHQRGGHQGTRCRRSSTTSSSSSQASAGSPNSCQPPQRNDISQSSDQTQVHGSQQPEGPTCSKCQLSFANSQELVHHFNTSPAHPNSGFSPPSPPSPSNISTLSALQPRSPRSGPSHCTKCDIMFASPSDLAAHFRESKDHPFSLPIVGYRYGVPVFDVEDSEFQFGVFDPRGDVTKEEHEETMIRRADHWYKDIDEEEAELICAMRRFDLGKYY